MSIGRALDYELLRRYTTSKTHSKERSLAPIDALATLSGTPLTLGHPIWANIPPTVFSGGYASRFKRVREG